MLSGKDAALVYETLLSSPGMSDTVKIDLRIPRRNVLLLAKLLEQGLIEHTGKEDGGILSVAGTDILQELRAIAGEMLEKGGLSVMNDRLNSLQGK